MSWVVLGWVSYDLRKEKDRREEPRDILGNKKRKKESSVDVQGSRQGERDRL
jgi:hypothetical protein